MSIKVWCCEGLESILLQIHQFLTSFYCSLIRIKFDSHRLLKNVRWCSVLMRLAIVGSMFVIVLKTSLSKSTLDGALYLKFQKVALNGWRECVERRRNLNKNKAWTTFIFSRRVLPISERIYKMSNVLSSLLNMTRKCFSAIHWETVFLRWDLGSRLMMRKTDLKNFICYLFLVENLSKQAHQDSCEASIFSVTRSSIQKKYLAIRFIFQSQLVWEPPSGVG